MEKIGNIQKIDKLECDHQPKEKIGCISGFVVYMIDNSFYIEIKYNAGGNDICDLQWLSDQRPTVMPC